MKKILLTGLLALVLAPVALVAQDATQDAPRVPPPVPIPEEHEHVPHSGWVWVEGHHHWNGHRYAWRHGYWTPPPHPGAVWVHHHWEQRDGVWVYVPGHWQ